MPIRYPAPGQPCPTLNSNPTPDYTAFRSHSDRPREGTPARFHPLSYFLLQRMASPSPPSLHHTHYQQATFSSDVHLVHPGMRPYVFHPQLPRPERRAARPFCAHISHTRPVGRTMTRFWPLGHTRPRACACSQSR